MTSEVLSFCHHLGMGGGGGGNTSDHSQHNKGEVHTRQKSDKSSEKQRTQGQHKL